MKKIISGFLLFALMFLNTPVFAIDYDEVKKLGADTVKVRKSNLWGVFSNTNEEILPVNYEKIKHIKLKPDSTKNLEVFMGKDKNSWVAVTPTRKAQDFFKNTYNYNNKNTWLKYTNYPTEGILLNKQGSKYGFIIISGKEARMIESKFDDVYFQDSKSAIYQQFGISFSNPNAIIVKKDKKWGIINSKGETVVDFQYDDVIMANARMHEDVSVKDDSILFNFKGIEFPEQDKLIAIKGDVIRLIDKKGNILLEKPTITNEIQFRDFQAEDFLNQVYEENNKKASFVKYVNYPTTGIYRYKEGKNYGLVICKKEGNKTIPAIYQGFMFQDSNSAIFQQLNVSFSNPGRILAKKGNKWGVIDEDNNAVVDFQYDNIIMLEAVTSEAIKINKDGVIFKYKNITFPQSNLLLVQKGSNFGVVDKDGNEIIPLKYSFIQSGEKPKKTIIGRIAQAIVSVLSNILGVPSFLKSFIMMVGNDVQE